MSPWLVFGYDGSMRIGTQREALLAAQEVESLVDAVELLEDRPVALRRVLDAHRPRQKNGGRRPDERRIEAVREMLDSLAGQSPDLQREMVAKRLRSLRLLTLRQRFRRRDADRLIAAAMKD